MLTSNFDVNSQILLSLNLHEIQDFLQYEYL